MRTRNLIQLIAILQLLVLQLFGQGSNPNPGTVIKYQIVASFNSQYSQTAIQAFVQQLNGTIMDFDNSTNSALIKLNPIRINNQDYLGYGSIQKPQSLIKASTLINDCKPLSTLAQGVPSGSGGGVVSSQGDGWNYSFANPYANSVSIAWTSAIETSFYAQFTNSSIAQGNCSVQVAIDDSGYNNGVVVGVQPSPFQNMLTGASKNYINVGMNPVDTFGHGTFVSGVVNGVVRSISRTGTKVKLFPYKILNKSGQGTFWTMIKSLSDLASSPADIINLSVRAILPCEIKMSDKHPLNMALDKLKVNDKLLICAAGNDGIDIGAAGPNFVYPAALSNAYPNTMITVGSVSATNTRSSFSNYGLPVQIYTLGENIKSTLPGIKVGTASGTSFSAPRVAGVAALMGTYQRKSGRCDFDPGQVIGSIKNTATPFAGNPGRILNATLAYQTVIANNLPGDGGSSFKSSNNSSFDLFEDELTLSAFPNPFQDHFQIRLNLPEDSKGGSLTLINIQGSVVQQSNIENSGLHSTDLFTGDLPDGLYLLQFQSQEGQIISLKLMKD